MSDTTNNKPGVLIVGDAYADIPMLTYILENNYTVYTAPRGKDGIKLAQKHKPSVILLDLNMPGFNSYEALGMLRNHNATRCIPIVFISENVFKNGLDDYIVKPFHSADVMSCVQNAVKTSRLFTTEIIAQNNIGGDGGGVPRAPTKRMFWAKLYGKIGTFFIIIMEILKSLSPFKDSETINNRR